MSYPYSKRYIDQIRENRQECEDIKNAFRVLRQKYVKDNSYSDSIDLSLKENFALLGEAFELASPTVGGISDVYHFVWDIEDELLTSDEEKEEWEKKYGDKSSDM